MRTLKLDIPSDLQINDYELSFLIAAKLFETGRLSSGQAAKIVGLKKRDFLERLSNYGTSVFSNSIDDLYQDIANA